MPKVQKSDPDRPSRTDSFLRMLELEKMYKMQRIHGHAPPTIASPSTTPPSAQPNNPFKARRASGHPPLSHQTQIMKAVRRSSALPSLSISIPPEPTENPAVGTDGISGELPAKEERTKTVTFTGPEEEEDEGDSSDQSSICQSPSWEQYGRKKAKKPKKREAEENKKSKEDKPANTLKKKGNRLSKVPPPHVQGVEPLTASRAQSAPELDVYPKSKTANLDIQDSARPGAMTNPRLESKPKSKGFLSGFRLQHGNVAAVQNIIDNQPPNGNRAHKSSSGVDPNFVNPRKPPSIQSAVSNSTRSISSLDQLPPSARNSSSSHGRSQSLLTSTLNKLKGPSYLYFRPSENADSTRFQRPSSAQEQDMESSWLKEHPAGRPVERPADRQPARPKERPTASDERNQQLPEFTFPPKAKRVTTQLTPDMAARGVRNHIDFEEPKDMSGDQESQEPTSFRNRRSQAPNARLQNREQAVEKERQPREDRVSRASKQRAEFSNDGEDRPPHARQARHSNRELEHQHRTNRRANGYVQPQVESWEESSHEMDPPSSSRRRFANFDSEKPAQAEANLRTDDEDDQGSVGTHASTIRPGSRKQGRSSPSGSDGRKHVTFPSSPNTIGRAVTSDPADEAYEIPVEMTKPPKREKPVEAEEIVHSPTKKPARLDKSADYFSFISQSYAPPALDLRSPMEGKFPSPRIEEEPEEDDALEHILRHIPVRRQVEELPTPPESMNHDVGSHLNATSRILKQKPAKNSPSLSSHYSDSDVPAFERLGLSPKAARILAGTDLSSVSTSQSNTDPSRTSSERSSSSTCDDPLPSPSTASTPDSLRPQAYKGHTRSHADTTSNTTARPSSKDDERTPQMTYKPPAVDLPSKHSSRSASRDALAQDDNWSRTALPMDLDNDNLANSSGDKQSGLSSSPQLVATPSSVTFAEDIKDSSEEERINRHPYQQSMPPRAQSALDIHSANFSPDTKQQALYSKKAKAGVSSISLPNSPPADLVDGAPRKSALRSRKNSSNSEESSTVISPGAAYLQEARKSVPIPPVPTSRALRPHYAHKNSSTNIKGAGTPEGRSDPLAKMLVECCNCKFFHDMPSRVYECMAKPDSLVEDKLLGVSATITTMVKCPWCAHGMTTQCCSGYAAVVYLKEKLHGK
ncbi:uncharacterized protein F4807DRAFT_460412 [Annulohypoxylon truncatum]|uniref:uncharacterized protein n=1 Tax=Annulohypoxylon truncatum TaxID=327061 RepID=UPI0020080E46|nr:uncharacterized protein F4807DRAFT_460412 [Annulohypoxylon truncatum]KAI1209665.1 hypothetical protein F4807DRAFT_460412 [Annulohypoxylon truncatum]